MDDQPWDYVIVGSGAGGAPLAARLAEAGMRVCVLEAGGDPAAAADRLPEDYDVPAFHPFACENPAMAWNFHVRHYADAAQQARDPKHDAARGGVLYPRAAAVGGCTVHNAMIFVLPHDDDWNDLARRTGDDSWRAPRMRFYLRRLEACHHRPAWRALRRLGIDPTGHGWDGWLRTEASLPFEALGDRDLRQLLRSTARTFVRGLPTPLASSLRWLRGKGDPNARPWGGGAFEGLCYTPVTTQGHRRVGARERLLQAAEASDGRLHVETDALAARVLFDADGAARGVEYLKGERLYRAHAACSGAMGERRQVHARREVILCGGAFNTPQLLMLSGIGDAAQLRANGIDVRADLPGVGRNLQDRYEVAVTHRMKRPWALLDGARFARDDALWRRWNDARRGLYASNGAALSLVTRSTAAGADPDLFCMALLARFEGYRTGFSTLIRDHTDALTWVVLKAHTRNRAGRVTLRSADPRDMPDIDFHYFEEGSDAGGDDLRAVVEGLRFVRRLAAPLVAAGAMTEDAPGPGVQSDEALARYVRDTAWGHHASCSCPIGDVAQGGVLASDFRVHGTRRLRVVDASVFPRIPGFFIASAVCMVSEKAAGVLLHDAAAVTP